MVLVDLSDVQADGSVLFSSDRVAVTGERGDGTSTSCLLS